MMNAHQFAQKLYQFFSTTTASSVGYWVDECYSFSLNPIDGAYYKQITRREMLVFFDEHDHFDFSKLAKKLVREHEIVKHPIIESY